MMRFFKNKDDGAWSIPKGEVELGEDLLETAKREFEEETGITPTGPFIPLTPIKQKGGTFQRCVGAEIPGLKWSGASGIA